MTNIRIFISSPGDVVQEREVSRKVIERVEAWFGGRVKLEGYFWEHEPMRTTRGDFQGQIPEPANFDLVVCILWSRLGSRLHPGMHRRADGSTYASGTEYEFESAMNAFKNSGRPDMLVYRRTARPVTPLDPPDEIELRLSQWKALQGFCEHWFKEGGDFKSSFNQYADCGEFERIFEEHLRRLVEENLLKDGNAATAPIRRERWWQGSPYRGLQAFEFEHEPIFFGRTRARDEVLGALQARWVEEKCPFVLIFGASGSGKSSLMRAGVVPWLVRPGLIEGVGLWRRAILKPSEQAGDLLEGLARVLVQPNSLPELVADGTTVEALAEMLRDEPKSIVGLIKGALSQAATEEQRSGDLNKPPVSRLALGLDQLEEVFTLQDRFDEEGRRMFFRALGALARSGYVWIVATLRSDFYSRCEESSELVELKKNRGQYHLLPPTQAELSQMIRYPAEMAGANFEEDGTKGKLEDIIARETQDQPGALPLLEYALDMLYQEGADDGILTHAEYDKIGRVGGAVAAKAEQTFLGLNETEKAAFDDVLQGLVTLGTKQDENASRKIAFYTSITSQPGSKGLVDGFLTARLFTGDRSIDGQPMVTVAHEALLRVWPRALIWTQHNRDFLLARSRLEQGAMIWSEKAADPAYLLPSGKLLEEAEDLLKKHQATVGSLVKSYIVASSLAVEESAEEEAREKIRRALRLHKEAETMWNALCDPHKAYRQDERFMRLSEIENRLVNALTFNPDSVEIQTLLAGIRRTLVEIGIQTKDLNLASIYLQKLKTFQEGKNLDVPNLYSQLQDAWSVSDPGQNKYVLRLRKIAMVGCWLPLIWTAVSIAITWNDEFWPVYLGVTFAITAILHYIAALFAVLVSTGKRNYVEVLSFVAILMVFSGGAALNMISFGIGIALIYFIGKTRMEKLLWNS